MTAIILSALLVSPSAFVYDLTLWTVPDALTWNSLRHGKGITLLVVCHLSPLLAKAGAAIQPVCRDRGPAVRLTVLVAAVAYLLVARQLLRPAAVQSKTLPVP